MNVKFSNKKIIYEIEAFVESETDEGKYYYVVSYDVGIWSCTCPQNEHKSIECKHIKAVKEEL